MKNRRLLTIEEIAVRNEMPFLDVLMVYSKINARVYARSIKRGEKFELYNPRLEEETFKLTERYLDIWKIKQLKEVLKNDKRI